MKVKIGNTIYDSALEPVMVIFSEQDKKNIANMLDDAYKYCSFPDDMDIDKVRQWMRSKIVMGK